MPVFRTLLGLTLIADLLLHRWPYARELYSREGLPLGGGPGWPLPAAHIFMVLCLACYAMLALGIRTRWAAWLSLLCLLNLHARAPGRAVAERGPAHPRGPHADELGRAWARLAGPEARVVVYRRKVEPR